MLQTEAFIYDRKLQLQTFTVRATDQDLQAYFSFKKFMKFIRTFTNIFAIFFLQENNYYSARQNTWVASAISIYHKYWFKSKLRN